MNEENYNLINQAFQMFNDQMNTDYSFDNVDVMLTEAKKADRDIAEFARRFPDDTDDIVFTPGYYKMIKGEAFVSEGKVGFIVRTDIEERGAEWLHVVLHELSHIFCATHELKDGSDFYERYCKRSYEGSVTEGAINGGYAIWREFIAEFLARLVDLNMLDYSLRGNTKYINGRLEEIAGGAPFVKTKKTNLLVDVMTAKEVLGAPDKETAFGKLGKFKRLQTVSWIKLLNTVYDQLFDDKRNFWEIDFEFIESLGNNYLALTTEIVLGLMGDSRDMAAANKIMGRMVAGIE